MADAREKREGVLCGCLKWHQMVSVYADSCAKGGL